MPIMTKAAILVTLTLLTRVVLAQPQPPVGQDFTIPPDEMPAQFDKSQGQPVLREALAMIRVHDARKQFSVSGAGLTAAVLDTGLRTTHVDFRGRVTAQRNWTPDNNGAPDNANDGQGHGTNVAGIIGASDVAPAGGNKGEHLGVAPGAGIIPLKVLTNVGRGNFTWVESALAWVAENADKFKISVVNLSLGDSLNYQDDSKLPNAGIKDLIAKLRERKIAVVVAAGNDYFKAKGNQGMSFPAIIDKTTSVGAVYDADIGPMSYQSGAQAFSSERDRITPFSQRLHDTTNSRLRTDIFAPGAAISSSGIRNDRGESVQQGTSQAAPMTAGVILLLQEYHLRLKKELPTVDNLENWLREGAVRITDQCDRCDNVPHTQKSFPRIDALGALNAAKKAIAP